jgi:DNA-directed RNA polymerase II subunit RPB1
MSASLTKELEDVRNLKQITKVQFGVLSPAEILKGSVCEITSPVTYEGTEPKINGLFDPRMGVIERGRLCSTCENNSDLCPGHFGHIELGLPVFYFQYINTVIRLLRCVCFRCSKLLVDKSDIKVLETIGKKTGQSRFNTVFKFSDKIKQCKHNEGCFILQPKKYEKLMGDKIKEKNNIVKIMAEFRQEAFKDPNINKFQNFTPKMCYNIFRKISDEDVKFLGLSPKTCRPEWLICTVLPVPPPAVRPSIRQDNNQRSEDDITVALIQIINKNNMIKAEIESGNQDNIDGFQGLLQLYIATHINNELPNVPQNAQRGNRPLKAIIQRLKGKEGRFRGNIMGKRCDFTGRTVITVEPKIGIDEYGVPYKIAMNLTFPEIVTEDNIEDMYLLVRNGPNKYPGAKSVRKMKFDCFGQPAPCTIYLKHQDVNKITLSVGDVVHRHLLDGDIALFNRQPSLHKMSMMAHRIRVLPQNTFRLNVTATTPYNADFDGDWSIILSPTASCLISCL